MEKQNGNTHGDLCHAVLYFLVGAPALARVNPVSWPAAEIQVAKVANRRRWFQSMSISCFMGILYPKTEHSTSQDLKTSRSPYTTTPHMLDISFEADVLGTSVLCLQGSARLCSHRTQKPRTLSPSVHRGADHHSLGFAGHERDSTVKGCRLFFGMLAPPCTTSWRFRCSRDTKAVRGACRRHRVSNHAEPMDCSYLSSGFFVS